VAAQRERVITDTIFGLLSAGATESQLARELSRIGVENRTQPADPAGTEPMSTPAIINVARPQFLYDTCIRRWSIYARWDFTNIGALGSELGFTPWCGECDLGGDDAFGITLSRNVRSVTGYSVGTWGIFSRYPLSYDRMFSVDANVDGVGFRGQDMYCKENAFTTCGSGDYSFYHGALTYTIGDIGCGVIQAFSKYGHSWTSSELTGLSVGPWSIGFQWSNSSRSWERGSLPSSEVTPC